MGVGGRCWRVGVGVGLGWCGVPAPPITATPRRPVLCMMLFPVEARQAIHTCLTPAGAADEGCLDSSSVRWRFSSEYACTCLSGPRTLWWMNTCRMSWNTTSTQHVSLDECLSPGLGCYQYTTRFSSLRKHLWMDTCRLGWNITCAQTHFYLLRIDRQRGEEQE